MSGLPPLLETNDPTELLGIAAGASLRDIKQAYARLIKVYRPEHTPQEFQRIHAAFEDLSRRLAGGYGHLPPREFQAAYAPARVDAEALEAVQEPALSARAPDPAWLHAEHFATREQAGASVEELASIWASGIEQDLDLVAAMFELSQPSVLAYLADNGHFAWARLAPLRFPHRGALWTLHAQARLAQGRADELLAEAQSEGFREAAEDDEHLREALWLPLTVAAWDQPLSAFEPFAWAMDRHDLSAGAKTFHQACQLQQQLKQVEGWRWLPPGFSDLIRFGRVSPELRHQLLLALQASLHSLPQSWWRLSQKLSDGQALLGFYLLGTLAMHDLTRETPTGALSERQRELLALAVKDAQTEPSSLSYRWVSTALMLALLLGIILICVLLYRAFQAVFGDGAFRTLLPPLEWTLATVVACVVLVMVREGIKSRFTLSVLRTDLARTGFGYQQVVDALDEPHRLAPNDSNDAAFKIYMTLNLAVQRSQRAQTHFANSALRHAP